MEPRRVERAPAAERDRGGATAPEPPHAPPARGDERPVLRLAMSRGGGLGLELEAPFDLGPLRVERLAQRLEGLRFPIDLSGGVREFRHRRGRLVELVLDVSASKLARALEPAASGVLGEPASLSVSPLADGALVGVSTPSSAMAFELVLAADTTGDAGHLLLLPALARGRGLRLAPHVLALRLLAAAARGHGQLRRGALVLASPVAALVRELLPRAGARAPSAQGFSLYLADAAPVPDRLRLVASSLAEASVPARVSGALELRELAGEGDDAALAGALDEARRLYLTALERAPRHPELVARVAWLDASHEGRAEAGLSLLVDLRPATAAGALGAALLERVGDSDGALSALRAGAGAEPYGPLAGRMWLHAAGLAGEPVARLEALDEARARHPSLVEARWARLEALLELGDARRALGEAQELEAATSGVTARREVWLRAASLFVARGYAGEAAKLFEQALRYAPDDPVATRGLAKAALELGQGARALELSRRALALAEARGADADAEKLALAEALVSVAEDFPAAIARARTVPPDSPQAPRARLLEARSCADLGDDARAVESLGRLADHAERRTLRALDAALSLELGSHLHEAAVLADERLGEPLVARRLAGLALRLRPRDRELLAMVRRLHREAHGEGDPRAERARAALAEALVPAFSEPAFPRASPEPPFARFSDSLRERVGEAELDDQAGGLDGEAEARVEQLTDRLRADPTDVAVAQELAALLERLGRDLELVALLSAQLEEAPAGSHASLAEARRAALLRLASAARARGAASEASLYESMASG